MSATDSISIERTNELPRAVCSCGWCFTPNREWKSIYGQLDSAIAKHELMHDAEAVT